MKPRINGVNRVRQTRTRLPDRILSQTVYATPDFPVPTVERVRSERLANINQRLEVRPVWIALSQAMVSTMLTLLVSNVLRDKAHRMAFVPAAQQKRHGLQLVVHWMIVTMHATLDKRSTTEIVRTAGRARISRY